MNQKILFILSLLLIGILDAKADSTNAYDPKWLKGEKKNITMQYSLKHYNIDTTTIDMSTEFEFIVSDIVIDTIIIELNTKSIKLKSQTDEQNEYFESLTEEAKKVNYIIKINNDFTFFRISNLEELYVNVIKSSSELLKKQGINIDVTEEKQNANKELIKAKIFQDCYKLIYPLLYPYTIKYPMKGNVTRLKYEALGSDTIFYTESISLLEEDNNNLTYMLKTNVDSLNWLKLITLMSTKNYHSIDINRLISLKNAYTFSFKKFDKKVYYIKKEETSGDDNLKMEIVSEYRIK